MISHSTTHPSQFDTNHYKPKSQSIPVAVHVVPDLQRQLIELGALAGTSMCGATYQGQCILDLEIAQQTMQSHRKMVV